MPSRIRVYEGPHHANPIMCNYCVYCIYIYIDITTVYVITSECIVHVVDYHICMLYMMYVYVFIYLENHRYHQKVVLYFSGDHGWLHFFLRLCYLQAISRIVSSTKGPREKGNRATAVGIMNDIYPLVN